MDRNIVNIRVFDEDINFLGEVDKYTSLFYIRKWNTFGEFEFIIDGHKNILNNGNLIVLNNDGYRSGVIEHIDFIDSVSTQLIVRGFSLGYWLTQRITVPPNNKYDTFNINIEDIMINLVINNAINPTDTNRKINRLITDVSKHRGEVLKFQTRYKNLSDELTSLSSLSGLGWCIYLDYENRKFIFKVLEGKNLTENQSVNPNKAFSTKFDNIKQQQLTLSNIGYKNMAYIGGQGEDEEREIKLLNTNLSGLQRREVFVDARDIEDSTKLIDRGKIKLSEMDKTVSLFSEVVDTDYQKIWDLGDIVTVALDNNIKLEKPIIQVKETYSGVLTVEPTFGEPLVKLQDKIKQSLDKPQNENRKTIISSERPVGNSRGRIWIEVIK